MEGLGDDASFCGPDEELSQGRNLKVTGVGLQGYQGFKVLGSGA